MSHAFGGLLHAESYIDGEWTKGARTFSVKNPADDKEIAAVADLGVDETRRAIEAASRAWPVWKSKTGKERAAILRKWFELINQHAEPLARLLTTEQGKSLAEAKSEIVYGASFVEWFAEEAKRAYGDVIPETQAGRKIIVTKEPIGVVAAITPWNFPVAMITRKVAPALAAGCSIVLKPADETPLCALALVDLATRAGIPAGVFNVITSTHAADVGLELTTNPIVRKVSFTGSTEVGKILMRQSASTLKKVSLELGGNAPFIVFEDADLDLAVKGAVASKFRNSGQTCVCTNRFLVHASIYENFATKLAEAVSALKVGRGEEASTQQGPLINASAIKKVEEHVADALKHGAQARVGGKRSALGGTFYEPTVLTGMKPEMKIANEETFGPVAALFSFQNEDEAVRLANATPYGLASYFYTKDLARAWRVSAALESGMVGINEGVISNEVSPFGGVKESGFGREGSKYGMEDYLVVKYCLFA